MEKVKANILYGHIMRVIILVIIGLVLLWLISSDNYVSQLKGDYIAREKATIRALESITQAALQISKFAETCKNK